MTIEALQKTAFDLSAAAADYYCKAITAEGDTRRLYTRLYDRFHTAFLAVTNAMLAVADV